ncbi:MAG TPA: hypothetical protein VL424_07075 [Pararobbsia sp.]|jgi:hypothetical protein|nr:hypothetical protein [Pararobbsia sp.]
MASLTIKDLPESIELDRAAMTTIVGGARTSNPSPFSTLSATSMPRPSRVFDYPPGFPNAHPADPPSADTLSPPLANDVRTKK